LTSAQLFVYACRGVAQLGSVPEWGSGGRWFKSSRPDQHRSRASHPRPRGFRVSRSFVTRILISNDDGIGSARVQSLAEAVSPLGEVWVVAPDRERSAIAQALSLNRPLRAKRHKERWLSVDGTPADCVYLALARLLPGPPDLILSGVNLGANLGQDV